MSRPLRFLLAAALVVTAIGGDLLGGRADPVAAATEDEIVTVLVDGVGNGHGRGLSQWGAYGWAVNDARSWTWILDHYYGGTTASTVSTSSRVTVRLVGSDDATRMGVISNAGTALWAGQGYDAVYAEETATAGRYAIYTTTEVACPGDTSVFWTYRGTVSGPVRLTTSTSESGGDPGSVLGLCRADGSVVHYRGSLLLTKNSAGANRVVNDVAVENYLRGVVTREVSTGWGDAGGGAGMNALRAQSVAARTYALAQNRYAGSGGYATTCDTSSCQAYGGAAARPSPDSALVGGGVCESGNPTFECANTNRAILETAGVVRRWPSGALVSTEFSASNGPYTAGSPFPSVLDPADDVPANPNHRWTRLLDADVVAAYWNLGTLLSISTEPDPDTPYVGVWDNRVRMVGTSGSQVVSGWTFRNAFGLPAPGITITAVPREVTSTERLHVIGDSVGVSVTETSTSELRADIDGVFGSVVVDAVVGRCVTGCGGDTGVAAAGRVPLGTDHVLVELGYNNPQSPASQIDAMMSALRDRDVGHVVWVNLNTRSPAYGSAYAAYNDALTAAMARWPELDVIDWSARSIGSSDNQARWFSRSDGIHLTLTGQAEFGRFLGERLRGLVSRQAGFPLRAGSTERITVLGRAGVPSSGVSAVVWNLTVVAPRTSGWVTVWPCDQPRPPTSNVVFEAGTYESTAVVAVPSAAGEVCVFSSAQAHVAIDQNGWFSDGFEPVTARRILDTRRAGPALPAGAVVRVPSTTPATWNLTVAGPAASGWVTVWPCDQARPPTSNVVFEAGLYESTAVVAVPSAAGEVCVFTSASTHLTVDQNGRFTDGFEPLVARRILDTRRSGTAPGAGAVLRVPVPGRGGVPTTGAEAVVWNLTVVDPQSSGWVTVWPCDQARPPTSNVVFEAGMYESTAVVAVPSAAGEVCVFTSAQAHVAIDQNGWFSGGFEPLAARRILDTRRQ